MAQFMRSIAIKALQNGAIPHHVGFIMDGNRRFGRKVNVGNSKGYYLGYDTLEEILAVCMELGVKVVTVYAFSIENFKRPPEQVETLMELAKVKLAELCEKSDIVRRYGVGIRVLGDDSLLPEDVRVEVRRAVELTKHNTRAIFNMCFPYTSRDELAMASRSLVSGIEAHDLNPSDVTTSALESSLYTRSCPPMELLIRTSGEIRLSDFMLWQSSRACHVEFIDCYWPEFTFWRLLPILLRYQIRARTLAQTRKAYEEREEIKSSLETAAGIADNLPSQGSIESERTSKYGTLENGKHDILRGEYPVKDNKQRVADFLVHRGHLPNCPIVQLQ